MSEPSPSVSIIILNWNGLSDTRECLQSLRAVSYTNFRAIVVDNGSDNDEATALRQEFRDFIHLIANETNLGFAGGMNTGIRYALAGGADYVLLLNNDTTVDSAVVSELVTAAQSLPDAAALCPKTYFYNRPDVIYSTGGQYNLWTASARQIGRGQPDRGQFDRIANRGYADGVCMLIPRQALERTGLLDEDYFSYWEETDWCARAGEQGLRCYYVPTAQIWHKAQMSQSPTNAFHFRYRRNAFLFVRKRGKPYHLASAILMHVFVFGPLYFLRHPTKIARAPSELKALISHVSNQERQRPLL
jgi:GT2 family glycosyltransferase